MKPVVFHPDARLELLDAIAWYADRSPRAAAGFAVGVEQAVGKLDRFAGRHARLATAADTKIQRVRIDRYPHSLVFVERDDHFEVLAVAHPKRRPLYWLTRVR